MLEINTAIENSFSYMHTMPRFISGNLTPEVGSAKSDEKFIAGLEEQFQDYQVSVAHWRDFGRKQRSELEADFQAVPPVLTQEHMIRIQLMIDDIYGRLEQDVAYNSVRLKHLVRMGKDIKKVSPKVGTFIIKLVERIRILNEVEMSELTDAIDWWVAVREKYSPDRVRSQIYSDPDELIANLWAG